MKHVLWAIALIVWLSWTYEDPNAPGHIGLVEGVYMAQKHPGEMALGVVGALGIWFGMRALAGRQ